MALGWKEGSEVFRTCASVYTLNENDQVFQTYASGTVVIFQHAQNAEDVRLRWEEEKQCVWWRLTPSELKGKMQRTLMLETLSDDQAEILALRFIDQKTAIDFAIKYYAIFPSAKIGSASIDSLFQSQDTNDSATASDLPSEYSFDSRDKMLNALFEACKGGQIEVVQELLETEMIEINQRNDGVTALYMAAEAGHHAICELLIRRNIDIDGQNEEDGTTALFMACCMGHLEVVRILLKYNADANLSKNDDTSPLIHACSRGDDIIVQELLQVNDIKINQKRSTDRSSALLLACGEGAVECVRHLLTNKLIEINNSW